MENELMTQCLYTYKKEYLNPLCPDLDKIFAEDIAHALSLMCRSNGHVKHFYSVAQHSLNCAREAQARNNSARIVLGCLLHDASEAYIADIVRPVKHNLPNYVELESILQRAIFQKFGLSDLTSEELTEIFDIDDRILRFEFIALMDKDLKNSDSLLLSLPKCDLIEFAPVENEFLVLLNDLLKENATWQK